MRCANRRIRHKFYILYCILHYGSLSKDSTCTIKSGYFHATFPRFRQRLMPRYVIRIMYILLFEFKPSLGRESQHWAVHTAVALDPLDPLGASLISAVFSL